MHPRSLYWCIELHILLVRTTQSTQSRTRQAAVFVKRLRSSGANRRRAALGLLEHTRGIARRNMTSWLPVRRLRRAAGVVRSVRVCAVFCSKMFVQSTSRQPPANSSSKRIYAHTHNSCDCVSSEQQCACVCTFWIHYTVRNKGGHNVKPDVGQNMRIPCVSSVRRRRRRR